MGGNAPELFEPIDEPLDAVALAIECAVKGTTPRLIVAAWDC